MKLQVIQICIGRFHHFHLARQLERRGLLKAIWTGYPHFKLKDESGIPAEKIKTFPWFHTPYMFGQRLGMARWDWLNKECSWLAHQSLDTHVASQITAPALVVGLSGQGLMAGKNAQSLGGLFICDRGSSHIRYQDAILREEYRQWGLEFKGVDPRVIAKEEAEYAAADAITIASEFVRRSFLEQGVPVEKVVKIPYGARLDRFKKMADPDPNTFQVLWVGQVTIRKGFLYLLEAFQKLRHPNKKLIVIGGVPDEIKRLLTGRDLSGVEFKGLVPNAQLVDYYSRSHVFVFPSIEDGFGMVMGEALACGCPVIASTNTGAEDLLADGVEGFIVPIRSSTAILEKLEKLIQDPTLRQRLSEAALAKVRHLGGWDKYGEDYAQFLNRLVKINE